MKLLIKIGGTLLDSAESRQRLTSDIGEHSVSLNPTGTLFVDSHSDPATPTRVQLRSTDGGTAVRTLDTNPVYVREELRPAGASCSRGPAKLRRRGGAGIG